MNIHTNVWLTPTDEPGRPMSANAGIRLSDELTLWFGHSDEEAATIIDQLVSILLDIRSDALARLTKPAIVFRPEHDRPFHLEYDPACRRCQFDREHGPAESASGAPRDSDPGYRSAMIDAGRGGQLR